MITELGYKSIACCAGSFGAGVIKRAKEIIPNCTTYLLKGRGHMNIMTKAEKEIIRDFFK